MTAPQDLLDWLNEQLAKAEKNLRARVQMEETMRGGTDAEWKEVAKYTGSKPLTKAQRTKEADSQKRISEWCRRDVAMFKQTISLLTSKPCN